MTRPRLAVALITVLATVLATSAPAQAAPLADPVEAQNLPLTNALSLTGPFPPWPSGNEVFEGGLSALTAVPGTDGSEFWTLSDRGPNGQPTGAPFNGNRSFLVPTFAPTIYRIRVDAAGFSIEQRIPLHLPAGGVDPYRVARPTDVGGNTNRITGLPNVFQTDSTGSPPDNYDETTFNWNGTQVMNSPLTSPVNTNADPYGLDTEGIALDSRDGSFWISEEYRPAVVHVASDGTILQSIVPQTAGTMLSADTADADTDQNALSDWYGNAGQPKLEQVLPREFNNRRQNRGLEGIAISSDGTRVYAMTQSSLDVDNNGPDNTFSPYSNCGGNKNNYTTLRIVELDTSDPTAVAKTGEWVYIKDAADPSVPGGEDELRVSDIAWEGPRELLVDERDDNVASNQKRLYEVNLDDGTNINDFTDAERECLDADSESALLARTTPKKPIDALGPTTDTGGDAEKHLVLDLTPLHYPTDKLEGITRLADGSIVTLNDNDFGFTQDNTSPFDVHTPGKTEHLITYRTRALGYADLTAAAGSSVSASPTTLVAGPDPAFAKGGDCPSWLAVDPADGSLSGTAPGSASSGQCTVTLTDADPGDAEASFAFTVSAPPPSGGGEAPPVQGPTPGKKKKHCKKHKKGAKSSSCKKKKR